MLRPRLRSFRIERGFDASPGRSVMQRAAAIVVASSVEADDLTRAGLSADRTPSAPMESTSTRFFRFRRAARMRTRLVSRRRPRCWSRSPRISLRSRVCP